MTNSLSRENHIDLNGDRYERFIGKINYIGHKLLTIGKKSKEALGLTFTQYDTAQFCQVYQITEEEFRKNFKGRFVIRYDLEGKPHSTIEFIYVGGDEEVG